MKTASRFVLVVGAFYAVVAMTNVSQAAIIASDNFNRADGGTAADSIGNSTVGGYHWTERALSGPNSSPGDVASVTGTEFAFGDAYAGQTVLNVNMSDAIANATMRFTTTPSGTDTGKGLGMIFRESDMNANFPNVATNKGAVAFMLTSSGGLLMGENKTGTDLAWTYNANPFNGAVGSQTYGAAGTLPTTYGSGSFDANGDGRLTSDEPFTVGAILSGTSLAVQINGQTVHTLTLVNTSGVTGNNFAFLKNALGGGDATTANYDNLTLSTLGAISGPTITTNGATVFDGNGLELDTAGTAPSVTNRGSWSVSVPANGEVKVKVGGSAGVPIAHNGSNVLKVSKPIAIGNARAEAVLSSPAAPGASVKSTFSIYVDSAGNTQTGADGLHAMANFVTSATDGGFANRYTWFGFAFQGGDIGSAANVTETGMGAHDMYVAWYDGAAWRNVRLPGGANMYMEPDSWHSVELDLTVGTSYTATIDGITSAPMAIESGLTGASVQGLSFFTNVNTRSSTFYIDGVVVPEPSVAVLFATGLLGLLAYAWRKRK